MTASKLTVISAPVFDPGMARRVQHARCGLTVAQIVAQVAPHRQPSLGHLRVTLTNDLGTVVIEERLWPRVRPKPGTTVIVRAVPGKDALRSVLLAVVAVAASTFAPGLAATIFGAGVGKFGVALVGAGLSIVGSLLVNALIPIETPDAQERRNVYRIDGWRNDIRPGAPVPCLFGKHRYAPPFAAQSYTEVVGDDQYIHALFTPGYGALRISDLRIGETPVSDFEDIDIETREGYADDLPVGLFPEQVLEESAGVQLVRPLPRDLNGDVIEDAESIETPVIRFTASNAARASVILGFQSGLFRIDSKGRRKSKSVTIRIRARLNGVGDWDDVVTLDVTAEKQESFLRQHKWTLPTRGRWQIEVTRMSEDSTDTQVSDNVVLSAVQSYRPEYPINLDKPLALIAVRVRATYQLNGGLDSLNAMIERRGPVRENGVWTEGYSRNPASAFLTALTGPQNPYPVAEAEIDMDLIADWYDWCAAKGLKYDRVHDAAEGLGDMLNAICGAGRASPRHDGVRWGVVIDRPETVVIDHINSRNSSQFEWSREYFTPPDAFRVRFLDETNNHEEAERIVRWPNYTGPINLTESIDLPGKTDPDEIYTEARRRMYELIYRPDSFSAFQSGAARVVTRGDLVMGSFDVLSRTQASARVKSVEGNLVEIDELVAVPDGYAARFRVYPDADDVVGGSVVRNLAASAEETGVLLLSGTGPVPEVGEVISIGPIASESLALRVRGIEAGDDFQSRLIMVAAAPEIDTLLDADVPPAWDGRVGAEIDLAAVVPAVPLFASIATGSVGTDNPDGLTVILKPGQGSTAQVSGYELDHRLSGSGSWTTLAVPAAASGVKVDAYAAEDAVELRARAFASTTPGGYSSVATVTVGADDPAIPGAIPAASVIASGGLGHAQIRVAIPQTDFPTQLQFYRVPTGVTLDRAVHKVGIPLGVSPGSTTTYIDGDATRTNLLANPSFDDQSAWTLGDDWSISDGKARRDALGNAYISQPISFEEGRTYRIGWRVSEATDGGVRIRFEGGATRADTGWTAGNGLIRQTLVALAGNDTFAPYSGNQFDGALDEIFTFPETAACIPADDFDYYFEPLSDEGVAGPVSGPFTVSII